MKQLLVMLWLTCLLMAGPTVCLADYDASMAQGERHLQAGNYEAAAEAFREALAERTEDPRAALLLGRALRLGGDPGAGSALKRALRLDPSDPAVHLELGRLYQSRGVYPEAMDYFETARDLGQGTETARAAQRHMDEVGAGEGNRYRIALRTGLQYDSNVALLSDTVGAPSDISDESDTRAVFDLAGAVRLLSARGVTAAAGYRFYQSLHADLDDFDLQLHTARLGLTWDLLGIRLGAIYSFDYTYLGSDKYSQSHNLSPSVRVDEGRGLATTLRYRYRATDYKNSERSPLNSDRTGDMHVIGVVQEVPLGKRVSLEAAYTYASADAEADYQDYDGHGGRAALRVDLTATLRASLSGAIHTRDYAAEGPIGDGVRKDTNYTASASVSKDFTNRLAAELSVTHIQNDSSLAVYEYDRTIVSLFAEVSL